MTYVAETCVLLMIAIVLSDLRDVANGSLSGSCTLLFLSAAMSFRLRCLRVSHRVMLRLFDAQSNIWKH